MLLAEQEWSCVHVARDGNTISEQWCPKGQLPSRAEMLLSRNRWSGSLGGPVHAFPDAHATTVAERSFVRPGMQVLRADERTAIWLVVLRNDVLMGDSWQIQVAHQGDTISTTCTLEIWRPAPETLDPKPVELVMDLVTAPDGVLEETKTPALDQVKADIEALWRAFPSEPIESWLKTLELTMQSVESVAPSLAANLCIAQLATRLTAVQGAAFFGLCDESVRLHRIVLRRTPRQMQPIVWAFSVRGAMLGLAELVAPSEISALVPACAAAIEKPPLDTTERAILYHCLGELLLRAEDPEYWKWAVTSCSESLEFAKQIDKGGSFLFAASECLARAHSKLGHKADEIAALKTALSYAGETDRPRLNARLEELKKQDPPAVTEPWVPEFMDWYRDEQAALRVKMGGRVTLLNPTRRAIGLVHILVLRPLLTANAPTVPNRFTNLLRHAWRFRDEPTMLTFEETLSRALGHLCSFSSRGAAIEGFGIGRIDSLPSDESRNPESWKKLVEVMVTDPILSRMVIVYPSDSPGMQWELDLLTSHPHPYADQVRVFMIPPEVSDDSQNRWKVARKVLASRNLKIPDWHEDGLIFTHSATGEILWSESFGMLWEGRLATWVQELAASGQN